MNKEFITTIVDTYLHQYNMYQTSNPIIRQEILENTSNDIIGYLRDLRENDIEIYNHIWDKSKSFQTKVISEFLKPELPNLSPITESKFIGTLSIYALLVASGAAITYYADKFRTGTTFNNFKYKIASNIGNFFNEIDFNFKGLKSWRFKYQIIKENSEHCYKQCGVTDLEELGNIIHYKTIRKSGDVTSELEEIDKSIKDVKTAECLVKCYLTFTLETIKLLFTAYFDCLKQNNQYQNVQKFSADDYLLGMTNKIDISNECHLFYDHAVDSIKYFREIVEYIYENDKKSYSVYMDKLRESINSIINNNRRNSNQPNKPNYDSKENNYERPNRTR